jgi:hypothetical protein
MLQTELNQSGLVRLEPLFNTSQLEKWNQRLDPIFASQDKARRYATAEDLMKCGLLQDLFQPAVRALINELIPNARVFHLHAYEINSRNSQSHIMSENRLDGWHRDYDCRPTSIKANAEFISFFVYLTDVAEDGGAFEISPTPLSLLPKSLDRLPPQRVTGVAGTSFLFNRVFVHRASPNQSPTQRRVLKLSIQPAHIENNRINLPQFVSVRAALPSEDLWLQRFFDITDTPNTPVISSTKPAILPKVEYGVKIQISLLGRCLYLYREFRYLKVLCLRWSGLSGKTQSSDVY